MPNKYNNNNQMDIFISSFTNQKCLPMARNIFPSFHQVIKHMDEPTEVNGTTNILEVACTFKHLAELAPKHCEFVHTYNPNLNNHRKNKANLQPEKRYPTFFLQRLMSSWNHTPWGCKLILSQKAGTTRWVLHCAFKLIVFQLFQTEG